ncbi:MAG: four helix bundle protein [Oscillochloridaceae bacterium umkhey_bin13]
MAIQSYRDLLVWQKSMDLVTEIYQLTRQFPHEELFGLTSQTRRAAVSIPANIAEGYGRIHRKEYLHHLSIARGSLMEVETHLQIAVRLTNPTNWNTVSRCVQVETYLQIAVRLTYLSREQGAQIWSLLQEVARLLNGLIRSLNSDNPDGKVKEEGEAYQLPET